MPFFAGLYYMLSDLGNWGDIPLVLIHGAGGTCLSWPPHIRRLTGQTVFALDLPGHGKSEGTSSQSIKEYAEILLNWSNKQKMEKIIICGHSMGGAICLQMALQEQNMVEKLILIGCSAKLKVNPQLLELASHQNTVENAVDLLVKWSFADHVTPRLVAQTSQRLKETRYPVLYNDLLACNAFDITEQLDNIQSSNLVLVGAHDKMTPVRHAKMLANMLPSANFEIIPDAGHMVVIEQPQLVSKHMINFLQSRTTYLSNKS